MDFCMVVTTAPGAEEARKIATAALSARLAACVQIFPIHSHYSWKGELREEPEFFILLKARREDYSALAETICGHHSYEVPEILKIDVADGDAAYLAWLAEATRK